MKNQGKSFNKILKLLSIGALGIFALFFVFWLFNEDKTTISAELPSASERQYVDARVLVYDDPLQGNLVGYADFFDVKVDSQGAFRVNVPNDLLKLPNVSHIQVCINNVLAEELDQFSGENDGIEVCENSIAAEHTYDITSCNRYPVVKKDDSFFEKVFDFDNDDKTIFVDGFCDKVYLSLYPEGLSETGDFNGSLSLDKNILTVGDQSLDLSGLSVAYALYSPVNTDNQTLIMDGNRIIINGGNAIDITQYLNNTYDCANDEILVHDGAQWLCGNTSNLDTLSYVTINGTEITYTDEDGNSVSWDITQLETTTTLVDNGDQTFTYTNEDGVPIIIDITNLETTTNITNIINGNTIATYTNEDGMVVDINETITNIIDNGDGTFSYTTEDGSIITIDVSNLETTTTLVNTLSGGNLIGTYTNEDGVIVNIYETVTTLVDNGNQTFTYTSEDGTITIIDITNLETTTTLSVGPNPGEITYINEDGTVVTIDIANLETTTTLVNTLSGGNLIGTYTNEDGVIVNIYETVTTLVSNGDGTYAYTSEDGTTTTITDTLGALNCTTNQVAIWNGTIWVCEDISNLETTTYLTNTLTSGNLIGTYENEDGTIVNIYETVTSIIENTDGTFTYIDENGNPTIIDISNLETTTTLTFDITNQTFTYINEDGVPVTVDIAQLETTTTLTNNNDGTLTYENEDGVLVTVDTKDFIFDATTVQYVDGKIECLTADHILVWDGTQWTCLDPEDLDDDLVITDNGDGTFTFTQTDQDGNVTTNNLDHKDFNVDGTTATYTDGKIACVTADHLLQWNGTAWECISITDLETTTTLVDNNDGTFTYTNEDNVAVTVDHKDFTVDGTTAVYTDGKISCVTADHLLRWNGTAWECVDIEDIDDDLTIVDNGDGTFTFTQTDQDGVNIVTTLDHKDFTVDGTTAVYTDGKISCVTADHLLQWDGAQWTCTDIGTLETTTTLVDNNDGTFSYTNEDNVTVTVDTKDFIFDATTVQYVDGKIECLTADHILVWDGTQWTCLDPEDLDDDLVITDNGDGTFTFTQTDQDGNVTTNNLDHKDFNVDGTTATYTDGKIACVTADHLLQWNGTAWECISITDLETTTTLVDNNDGTFTYTNEDNVAVTVDHKDFTVDGTTAVYTDGKISCVTADHLLRWNGTAWECVDIEDIDDDLTIVDNGDGTFTFTQTDQDGVNIVTTLDHKDFTVDGTTAVYTDGKISCVTADHLLQWDGAQWTCTDIGTLETTTTLVDNNDGTFSYTNEDNVTVTVDTKDFIFDATTVQYVDGKIQCIADEHFLRWDATNAQWECVDLEDIDDDLAITDNGDGTFTFTQTDENGTPTTNTLDHKDFTYDAATIQYVDGKIQCITADHLLQWTGTQWTCVSLESIDDDITVTLINNPDGTYTMTVVENGVTTNYPIDTKDFTVDGTTAVYNDGQIECATVDHLLQWDGTQWICVADSDTVGSLSCADDQIARWDAGASAWICSDDVETNFSITDGTTTETILDGDTITFTAGSGLEVDVSATDTVDYSLITSCNANELLKWNGTTWACAVDIDTDTDTTIPNTDLLASLSCATGELLKWNGTTWACAVDIDTDTDTLAGLSCADTQVATWDAGTTAWICADQAGGIGTICSVGQFLQYNGTVWVCVDDDIAPVLDQIVEVEEAFLWAGEVTDPQVHDNSPLILTQTRADAGWAYTAPNQVAYTGSPDHVDIDLNLSIDATFNSYWATVKVYVLRNGVKIAQGGNEFMLENGSYSDDQTVHLNLIDDNPGTNPVYTFTTEESDVRTGPAVAIATQSPVSLKAYEKKDIEATEEYTKAFGKIAADGTDIRVNAATATRTGAGQYAVSLNTPRSTGDYVVQLTTLEPITTRDSIEIHVTTQTPAGFTVEIHEGDNGTNPNTLRDRIWYFEVIDFN